MCYIFPATAARDCTTWVDVVLGNGGQSITQANGWSQVSSCSAKVHPDPANYRFLGTGSCRSDNQLTYPNHYLKTDPTNALTRFACVKQCNSEEGCTHMEWGLNGNGDGAGGDEKWLYNVLFKYVGNRPFSHIDPCCFLSLSMLVSQFRHSGYGVEPGVLSQSVRNDFHGVGKLLEAVSICACQCVCMQHQLPRNLSFWGSASSDQKPLLDQASNDTECVVD